MDNGVGNITDAELARLLGEFMPGITTYTRNPVPTGRAVSALTAAYVNQPIEREIVVKELAPLLVHAYTLGTIRKHHNAKDISPAKRLKWARHLIRQALIGLGRVGNPLQP